uniref:Uncharacterized protein n=1 Tax=Kalanchoe fedtschenkoi TaxID=63787 RepID=A0A7N0VJ77_KALFE
MCLIGAEDCFAEGLPTSSKLCLVLSKLILCMMIMTLGYRLSSFPLLHVSRFEFICQCKTSFSCCSFDS